MFIFFCGRYCTALQQHVVTDVSVRFLRCVCVASQCRLVDAAGYPTVGEFAAALNGLTVVPLHGSGRAEFQLKMLATNGGDYLRLRFDIAYELDGAPKHCVVITDAFRVDTNVRRRVTDRRRKVTWSSSADDILVPSAGSSAPSLSMSGSLLLSQQQLSLSASSIVSTSSNNANTRVATATVVSSSTAALLQVPGAISRAAASTATTSQHDETADDDDAIRALAELSVQVISTPSGGRLTPP